MSKEYIKAQTPLPAYFPYPKFLLRMSLSHTARLTYVLLLDRMTLSQKNGWVDVQSRAYVLYPLAGLAEDLQSSISSITRALRELEAARLIERRSNGFSKPNQIFLVVPRTAQKCAIGMVKNEQPDCSKVSNTIAQNCTSNQINKNNLRLNQLSRTKEAYGRYRNVFLEDYGQNPQMQLAQRYVEHWPEMREKNVGLLLWGGVGTGKSYMAGCIANALMEQEVAVCMTNFARIMNELNNAFAGRNEVVDRLCGYPLLIIDDFGMERGTEYALEQIYNIIDSRYRSRKPLIVTTNLTLTELKNPQDTAHARIYDRLLELCTPISCTGPSMRKNIGQAKLDLLKTLLA